jgi:hypothetical protein
MDKREHWALIPARAPDVAAILGDMREVFGRPAAMVVLLSSGEVVEYGSFSRCMGLDKRRANEL